MKLSEKFKYGKHAGRSLLTVLNEDIRYVKYMYKSGKILLSEYVIKTYGIN